MFISVKHDKSLCLIFFYQFEASYDVHMTCLWRHDDAIMTSFHPESLKETPDLENSFFIYNKSPEALHTDKESIKFRQIWKYADVRNISELLSWISTKYIKFDILIIQLSNEGSTISLRFVVHFMFHDGGYSKDILLV